MAGTGAGYDLSVSTFSPDGRVFQVEYACKAVDSSGLCIAARCRDGVVFVVEKPKPSPLLLPSSMRRIHAITEHIGMAIVGLPADGRQLVKRAREEAAEYLRIFGVDIQAAVLAERIGLYMHAYSLYWSVRPFGAAVLIGAVASPPFQAIAKAANKHNNSSSNSSSSNSSSSNNSSSKEKEEDMETKVATAQITKKAEEEEKGKKEKDQISLAGEIYCVDPSGCCSRYIGTALGKGGISAKTELEKVSLLSSSFEETLLSLLKICFSVNDEERQTNSQIEGAYIPQDGQFQMISQQQLDQAIQATKQAIQQQQDEDEEDDDM